jgi:hypothetical protein
VADSTKKTSAEQPEGGVIIKQNPEVPSQAQVDAATTTGPPPPTVTITDSEGNNVSHKLGTDDAALIASRAAATASDHPAHTTPGWSNPDLQDPTDEEKDADQKEYAKRFGGVH